MTVPPAMQVASLALDGMSYLATGKSVTDHAISAVTEKDCAMARALQGGDICAEPEVLLAVQAETPDGGTIDARPENGSESTP